ncbi:MAG: M28 family peptidase [Phycisphaerae bacterium]|nr:M28 family peptidase [Phycisphaerae bacterium]
MLLALACAFLAPTIAHPEDPPGAAPVAPDVAPSALAAAGQRPLVSDRLGRLLDSPRAENLRALHDLLAAEPHVAGTPGDRRVVDKIAGLMRGWGLEVEVHEIWPMLPRLVDHRVEIMQADGAAPIVLPLKERPLADDPYTLAPDLPPGWNGFSGSGDVTGEVVYVNRGTKADFEQLAALGVDVRGRVAIARYGGNYRGYKARFAERAGAAALLIYTDPADSGYMMGVTYPEGGYANGTHIERGSLVTLAYQGDPLTPGTEATRDATRIDPATADLPSIPVQPLGYDAAREILQRMRGAAVPREWQGGLPLAYRLTGGPGLKVRVTVEQSRAITPTWNVVGAIRGASRPNEAIYIGCHHDAWVYGAADPLSGMISLLEAARSWADAARRGEGPGRTLVFGAWGAEEMGIIGSSEWVEGHRDRLLAGGVAYINLDMASMGPTFGAGASPSLRPMIARAAARVPAAAPNSGQSVLERWLPAGSSEGAPPTMGDMGGGSDHVGFWCHAGVASASFGASGSAGTSYHSIYDTLAWYRKVVGDDYEPALLIARMTISALELLADEAVIPLDAGATLATFASQTRDLRAQALRSRSPAAATDGAPSENRLSALADRADRLAAVARSAMARLAAAPPDGELLDRSNQVILELERAWIHEPGLEGRAWFKNLLAAPDEDSGYASWTIPGLRRAVMRADASELDRAAAACSTALDRVEAALQRLSPGAP